MVKLVGRIARIKDSYFTKVLLLFMIFAMIPLLASGILTYGIARLSMEDSAITRSGADVKQLSVGIDALIIQHMSSLEILCEDEDIINLLVDRQEENYYKANYKLALTVGGNSKQISVHVVSADEQISATTGVVPKEYLYPYHKGWGIFRKADISQQAVLHVNDSMLANETGAIFSLAKAVRDQDNNVLGYVIIDVKRENITALLLEKSNSISYILDSHNFVVYSSKGTAYEGVNHAPDYILASLSHINGAKTYAHNGVERVALVFADIPEVGFTLINEIPLAQVTQNIQTIRTIIFVVILLMVLVCPLVAILAARNISAPIRKLTRLMSRVKDGDFDVRTGFTKNDEIGVMGRTFDHMAEQIKCLVDTVEEKQRSLSIAQMKALQAQINPHFLYNTLDLIKYKAMLGETDDVAAITVQLGRMLRYLASVKEDFVNVSFELDFILQYIDIQKRRYGDRLNLVIDIAPEVMKSKIPKLILQPAVENAIIHGLENKIDNGVLTIQGHVKGLYNIFTISDNGVGIKKNRLEELIQEQTNGASSIGLRNVHTRARLYGDEACGVKLQSQYGIGTTVTITTMACGEEKTSDQGINC